MEKWLVGLSIVVGIVTIWSGIYQYKTTSARNAMSPFLESQLKTYQEIMSIVGEMASTNDEAIFQAKSQEFWSYYYGPLALVEDYAVESAMVSIGDLIKKQNFTDSNFRSEMSKTSLALASACRRSVSKGWQINLAPLEKSLIDQP